MDVYVLSEFDGAEAFVFADKADAIASVKLSYANVTATWRISEDGAYTTIMSYTHGDVPHVGAVIKRVPVRIKAEHL